MGILQCLAMLGLWFRKTTRTRTGRPSNTSTLATVALLYFSFLFSMKAPVSHTFYLTFPVAMLYSLYCWSEFLQKRGWQTFAKVFIVCGLIF